MIHHVRERYTRGEFELEYVQSCDQEADVLTKPLPPRTHSQVVKKIGLVNHSKSSKMAFMCVALLALCMQTATAQFHIDDPVIWKKTSIMHIEGQTDVKLSLFFHDPCPALFRNRTNLESFDLSMIDTCSRRFKADILNQVAELDPVIKPRRARDGGVTVT